MGQDSSETRKLPLRYRLLRDFGGFAILIGILFAGSKLNRPAPDVESDEELLNRLRDEARQIRAAINSDRHDEAVVHARELVYANPEFGGLWTLFGDALLLTEQYDDAITAFESADSFHRIRAYAQFGLARAHAGKGENDEALAHLEAATNLGFKPRDPIGDESVFAALAEDSRFLRLAEELNNREVFDPDRSIERQRQRPAE